MAPLGPALFTFISVVAVGSQRTARRVQTILGALADNLSVEMEDSGLLGKVLEARAKLIWDQSSTAFLLAVIKSATVAMPLVIVFAGYIIEKINDEVQVIEFFLPKPLIDLITDFYS